MSKKTYLGDGVYAEYLEDRQMISLETQGPGEPIYLEGETLRDLVAFAQRIDFPFFTLPEKKTGYLGDVNGPGFDPDTV